MNYPRCLRMRKHSLCGGSTWNSDRTRAWVTCPKCQRIIRDAHPNTDPAELFNHPVA